MVKLTEMGEEAFQTFLDYSIRSYAKDNVEVGRWTADGSIERARKDVEDMLPQGRATPNHWFFELEDDRGQAVVGFLWFAIVERAGLKGGYIYDIEVYERYRRYGFARAALNQIERLGVEMGLPFVDLHVFGANSSARRLYEGEGYSVLGVNMRKML